MQNWQSASMGWSTLRLQALLLSFLSAGMLCGAEGDLDPRIIDGGLSIIPTPIAADTTPAAAAQLASGMVLVGSTGSGVSTDAVIVKLLDDGSLDAAFGDQGVMQAPLSSGDNWLNAVCVLPDDSLLAAGAAYGPTYFRAVVIHLLPDGSLDPNFGSAGIAYLPYLDVSDEITAVAVDALGNVLIAGNAYQNSGASQLYVGRLTAQGALDTSFGTGGQFEPAGIAQDCVPDAIAAAGGGILVVATSGYGDSCVAVRLRADGGADASYGSAGLVQSGLLGSPVDAAIGADGSCVFLGLDPADFDVGVLRIGSDGNPLATFGTGGMADVPGTLAWTPRCCLLDGSGAVDAFGDGGDVNGNPGSFALRLLATGDLDPTFGTGGVQAVQVDSGTLPTIRAVTVSPEGFVLVGDRLGSDGHQVVDAIPILADGTRGSYQGGTVGLPGAMAAEISAGHQLFDALCVKEQADGTATVAGITTVGAAQIATAVRCTAVGAVDVTYGTSGFCMISDPRLTNIAGAAIASDGGVVFVGDDGSATPVIAVLRVAPGGTEDAGFGSLGVADSGISGSGHAIALQGDGDIVAAGYATGISCLIRYLPDGTLDTAFGTNGTADIPQLPPDYINPWIGLAVDDTYGIYLTGNNGNLSLVRVLGSGAVDLGFAPGGAAGALLHQPPHPRHRWQPSHPDRDRI